MAIRKLVSASQGALGFGPVLLQGDDGPLLPWDVVREKLAELLRFLASALPALAAGIQEWAAAMERRARSAFAVALPAAAVVALVVVLCCCCGYCAAGGRRRRRGPDREEADDGGADRQVARYGGRGRGGGGYRGGIFSMHPNKPFVC